ncbi:hypothetical protein MKW98_021199 [Papaver atlanticum]|uniref:DNA2/NAM7 helicase helicase domain-containing protein n=1 Tax=Papaver atlanticum TaxID=357466 RepID=A0AAD4T7H1_9MAGN|nr:hypothetical protein MKW98_021199 [Papaver atlanticum]
MRLLEETRMEICSQMDFMSGAPHAEVTSVEESELDGGFTYCIKIDSWRNRYGPSDLFLLGDSVPEVAADLQRFGSSWPLASVVEDVKTSKTLRIEMKEGRRKSLFVVFLVNLATNTRTWKALHINVFHIGFLVMQVKENCGLCSAQVDRTWAGKVDSQLLLALNESQRSAVLGTISAMQTGKTKTISILLYNLQSMNYRTLACAPKNVAVAELALRVLNLHKDACESDFPHVTSQVCERPIQSFSGTPQKKHQNIMHPSPQKTYFARQFREDGYSLWFT